MTRQNIAVSLFFAVLGGCSARPPATSPIVDPRASSDVPGHAAAEDPAARGVDNPGLQEILREQWAYRLRASPLTATRLGVHDYDDQLGERGPAARRDAKTHRDDWMSRLHALDDATLSSRDRVTKALLVASLRNATRTEVCEHWAWRVSANSNPTEWISAIATGHPIASTEDAENLRRRYEQVASHVDGEIADLRDGLSRGLVSDAESLRRVLEMVDRQLAQPTAQWPLLEPTRTWGDRVDPSRAPAIAARIETVVDSQIRPALERYRDLLRDELVPAGRPPDAPGVSALPHGMACYAALIEQHTSLPLTAREVHELGLAEIARSDAALAKLGRRALGTTNLATTLTKLRSDRALYFETPEEIEAAAQAALARAREAMPRFFGRLPRADCVVRRVPDFKAPFSYIGYYEPAHADGSKPGEYFVNVLDPHTRPRFEARVLAVHESIPGHHLEIAISQELEDLPAFRRHEGYNSYVEGWALYTERLADEMGLYETDLDRLGMLSFDAWRAGRLVVDTGIHALGWTRAEAEAFLLEHTALAPNNISNEVDRYIGWPGQALGYKIGQLEILRLRAEAEAAFGEEFDLAAFHDVVLGRGPVTLPVLRDQVQAWIAAGREVTGS